MSNTPFRTLLTDLDNHRRQEAERNPLFNPLSCKWVVTIIQGVEIVAIRQNNQHGFISLGWEDIKNKFILGNIYSTNHYTKKQKEMVKKWLLVAAKGVADALNKEEKKE